MHYLTVDGMMSGSGIRDCVSGDYREPSELGLSDEAVDRIEKWLRAYRDAHFGEYKDESLLAELDREGIAICQLLLSELDDVKVDYYYSDARGERVYFDQEEKQRGI